MGRPKLGKPFIRQAYQTIYNTGNKPVIEIFSIFLGLSTDNRSKVILVGLLPTAQTRGIKIINKECEFNAIGFENNPETTEFRPIWICKRQEQEQHLQRAIKEGVLQETA